MYKGKHLLMLMAIALLMTTILVTGPVKAAPGDWVLTWSDEFNSAAGSQVSLSNWTYEVNGDGGGNGELQYYTDRPENSYLEQDPNDPNNRVLVIKGIQETYLGKSYTSARMNTKGKREFKYGKVEMRAKLPYGKGIWPAFWMLGNDIDTYGWAACGEIDIMEFVGQTPNMVYGSLHGPEYNGGGAIGAWHRYDPGFSSVYHTYSIEWDPEMIAWYFDGQLFEVRTIKDLLGTKEWVYDHPFFIILNLAIGGAWPGSPDATTVFPQYYKIDYVRVYQREGNVYPSLPTENLYEIQALANNKWVSADKANGNIMIANRTAPGFWEMFDRKDLGNGNVALMAKSNYKYASATGTGSEVLATGEAISSTETLQQISNADGTVSFKASNGKYLTINSTDSHLYATASTISTTEKFNVVKYIPTPTPVTPSDGSISKGKPVTASSFQSGNMPQNANDNNASTRWGASSDKYPQWWMVDLQAQSVISRVDINWYNGTTARAYQYKIEVSTDGTNFTTMVDKTGNTTQNNTSDSFSATARYVRVTVTGATVASYIYASAYEIKVFGTGGNTPTPGPTATPTPTQPPATATPTPTKPPVTATPTPTKPTVTATPTPTNPPATATPTPTGTAPVVLSQGKTASASSYQAQNPPPAGNDGNTGTRWAASGATYPQWWKVDLGAVKNLSKVDISWYNASGRAYKYKIEVSNDDGSYTTVIDKTGNTTYGNTSDSFTSSGRYVRITVTGCTSGAAYASFYECKVYGN